MIDTRLSRINIVRNTIKSFIIIGKIDGYKTLQNSHYRLSFCNAVRLTGISKYLYTINYERIFVEVIDPNATQQSN